MPLRVSNIAVGYDRKRQPAQFESAGASVHFTLTEDDGSVSSNALLFDAKGETDYVAVARMMLGAAKTLVLQELGVVAVGTSASAHDVASNGKAETGAKTEANGAKAETAAQKKAREKAEQKAAAEKAAADASDIPGETAPKQSRVIETKASLNDEIPGESTKPAAVAQPIGNAITHAELLAFISGEINAKRLDSATVKGITAGYNKPRIADIPAESLPEYKKKLDAKIAEMSAASDL